MCVARSNQPRLPGGLPLFETGSNLLPAPTRTPVEEVFEAIEDDCRALAHLLRGCNKRERGFRANIRTA